MRIEIQDKTITKKIQILLPSICILSTKKQQTLQQKSLKKEIQTKDINVEIPHLKYNKTWMLMLTQDDCMQAAFCRTWAAINGKPISSSIPYPTPTPTDQNMKHQLYFDIKHLQKGDLPPTIISANQSLGCTAGAGNDPDLYGITYERC